MKFAAFCLLSVFAFGCSGQEPAKGTTSSKSKELSTEFTKAGLKALITVKHGVGSGQSLVDQARIQSALDDAELAAATESEKTALGLIQVFRFELDNDAIKLKTRILKLQNEYQFVKHSDPRYHMVEIAEAVTQDPETLKDNAAAKACSDGIEKMLRSGVYAWVADCGSSDTKSETKSEDKPESKRTAVNEHGAEQP